ncbi:MAG: hypothetical protein Q7R94_02365, partial [bacterium]|nr:hypothetical protein [bacterium]
SFGYLLRLQSAGSRIGQEEILKARVRNNEISMFAFLTSILSGSFFWDFFGRTIQLPQNMLIDYVDSHFSSRVASASRRTATRSLTILGFQYFPTQETPVSRPLPKNMGIKVNQ